MFGVREVMISAAVLAVTGGVGYGFSLQDTVSKQRAAIADIRSAHASCEARVGFLLEGKEIDEVFKDATPDDLAARASEWLRENPNDEN